MPHIKGTALIPAVKLYRKNREKMDPFLGDVAKKLAGGRILPGSWYPLEHATELLRGVARFYGGSLEQAMQLIGAYMADSDLRGVYAHIVHRGDVVKTARRAVTLWRSYMDTGTLLFLQPDPSKPMAILRLENFEQSIPYCKSIIGVTRVVLTLAGAEGKTEVTELKCTLRGDEACEFQSVWG